MPPPTTATRRSFPGTRLHFDTIRIVLRESAVRAAVHQYATIRIVTAPPGRKRSETSRRAILDATFALLREGGLPALTIEGIAAKAGVGKTTIYRWWPSKGVVAVDALLEAASPGARFPARGADVWADLTNLLVGIAGLVADPELGPHLAAAFALTQADPAAAAAFRERIFGPTRIAYRQRLVELQDAGTLLADPDDVLDMAFGPLWFRLLTRPEHINPTFARAIATGLRRGVAHTSAP
jgi:AcrR family transcriptional regulator